MADQKTEKPTPRRRQKAREQGQIVRTRELPNVLATAAAFSIVVWRAGTMAQDWRGLFRTSLEFPALADLEPTSGLFVWTGLTVARWTLPIMAGAFMIALGSSVMQGGLVFAPKSLTPNAERLSPVTKFKQLFSPSGLSSLLKSILPFAAIVYLVATTVSREWRAIVTASDLGFASFLHLMFSVAFAVTWKSLLVLLVWAAIDYVLVWRKHEGELRMSKEEMRQEFKETEANPQVKIRIRQLQRRIRRLQMLKDTKTATVVIANPTHVAVALRYQLDMPAPVVVAKGRDMLAQQIKEVARWHEIPIVENPPLAQLLYRVVPVGHDIPAKLYTAVAEILAAVYRAQAKVRQQTSRPTL